jgi:hypothetical protein
VSIDHNPRPWTVGDTEWDEFGGVHCTTILDADTLGVAHVLSFEELPEQGKEAADLIVRAVNAHDELLAFAKAHERWEADLVTSNEAWKFGARALPEITEHLWDGLMELQRMRNAIVRKAEGGGA